jgi:hypothetical protein
MKLDRLVLVLLAVVTVIYFFSAALKGRQHLFLHLRCNKEGQHL